ncbi:hypothetical protein [Neisseria bacilliformis]|uniref:hypothetical protein n=1 Tax=Neisseria bacilliformis TaxID=267212 RepID=UPI0028E3E639|nr:hypothetical protein [Neisseria bacilliformis]
MSPRGDARVLCCFDKSALSQQPKPRAWLRRTPYFNGRGRLKTGKTVFQTAFFDVE